MHICQNLHSRLEELKKELERLDALANQVQGAESKQDLESLDVDRNLRKAGELLVEKQQELEGLKLNFKGELIDYLLVYPDSIDYRVDQNTGYLKELILVNDAPKRIELDFSSLHELEVLIIQDIAYCYSLESLIVPIGINKLQLSDCKNLQTINSNHKGLADLSKLVSLENVVLSRSYVLKEIRLSSSVINFDSTNAKNLQSINSKEIGVADLSKLEVLKSIDISGCGELRHIYLNKKQSIQRIKQELILCRNEDISVEVL